MDCRLHHYLFAHIVLREHFFDDPPAFAAALINEREALLERIWSEAGDMSEEIEEQVERLPSDGLELSVRKIGSRTQALIVSLPAAERPAEAHFVALVVGCPRQSLGGRLRKKTPPACYITLERSLDMGTMLCEWRGEVHRNFGTGPEATIDAFASCLPSMMSRGGRT